MQKQKFCKGYGPNVVVQSDSSGMQHCRKTDCFKQFFHRNFSYFENHLEKSVNLYIIITNRKVKGGQHYEEDHLQEGI
jgi:hypothetical protein